MKSQNYISSNVYKINEVIGEGSKGIVYRALQSDSTQEISQVVAVKVLNEASDNIQWKKEFISLSRIRSPFCVAVLGFEWLMDRPSLILEYIEGVSLTDLVSYESLSEDLIKEIAAQALRGLQDLWSADLVHGDLSPSNVIISTSGQVKLLDFGLANFGESGVWGTPQFISPEVSQGSFPTQSSDLFSLGKSLDYVARRSEVSKDFTNLIETLQSCKPEARPKKFYFEQEGKNKQTLGDVSKTVFRRLEREKVKTEEFIMRSQVASFRVSPKSQFNWHLKAYFGFFLAALLLVSVVVWNYTSKQKIETSRLAVRPSIWYQVWVNGKDMGYTPLDEISLPSGEIEIRWMNNDSSGHRTLTLVPGENRVIKDSFFKSQGKK